MKNLIDVRQAAEMLGVRPSTLYSYVRRRALPHHRIGDRVLFDPEELLAATRVPAGAEAAQPLPTHGKGRR